MADPAPTERPMPVGYGFRPNDRELVGHYLYRKLMADDLSIHDTIPEIGVCKYEPRDLLAWAASAASATKFDDFQCYFFSPRDYKYCNGKQFNRTTSRGFWKVTGRDRKITNRDTNNVIEIKKTLVFYEGRIPDAQKTDWVIHEYHDAQLPPQQEHVFLNTKSMIQPSCQLNEATDSMIQPSSQLNEATDSMIQLSFHEATDSMIQLLSKFTETTDSMIQSPSQLNNANDSTVQTTFRTDEVVIQPTFKADEVMNSVVHTPAESNSAFEALFDAEVDPVSLWQLPPAPSMDEQGICEIMATSDVHCHD